MAKPPTKWSFPRRSATPTFLDRFVGQEVNIFGARSCEEHDNCLGGGFLLGADDGFLLLTERPGEEPDLAIALSDVVVIAVVKDRPELTAVDGGKVHGQWPGLAEGQLIGPGDLAVTTDYRDVLSEILTKRLNNPATNEIFPEYQPKMLSVLK